MGSSSPRILVAYKQSSYEKYVARGDDDRIEQLLADRDISVARYMESHESHTSSVEAVCEHLESLGLEYEARYRGDVETTEGFDLVLTVGGDGTVLDISHRVESVPVLAINSDPRSSVGYFTAGTADDFPELLERTLEERWEPTSLLRFRVRVDDEQCSMPVLNDVLICHANPAAVSRYILRVDGYEEEHKSSGIWVATPAGSTAAIRSAGGYVLPLGCRMLQYHVREPYPPPQGAYRFTKGVRMIEDAFTVVSKMHEGHVYLDGPHIRHSFGIGDRLSIDPDAPPLGIYGLDAHRRII